MGKSKIKHVVNWNYIATVLGVIAIIITLIIYSDDKESSNLYSTIQHKEAKVQDYKNQIMVLQTQIIDNPDEEIDKVVRIYENKMRVNRMIFEDSLLKVKDNMSDGSTLSQFRLDSIGEALSYGLQALEELDIYDKRFDNQNKQIQYFEKIVKTQDSIINSFRNRN